MSKKNKTSKSKFYVEINARFSTPDKKEKMKVELDIITHGKQFNPTNKYVGSLRRIKPKK